MTFHTHYMTLKDVWRFIERYWDEHLDADRCDVLVAHPHAREARHALRVDAELRERVDDDVLERAHVGDDVTLAVAPLRFGISA